jgi:GxxExxY protein
MMHEELSGKIIGTAMEVLNELKPGLDEKLYERAIVIELKRRGHNLSIQRSFPVYYRGELIGNLIPDLIIDDAMIVDPKVVSCFTDTHVAQMLGYLNITGLDLGLLINFKNARLDWKRILRPQATSEHDMPDLLQ